MTDQHRTAMKLAQDGFLLQEDNPQEAQKRFVKAFALEREVAYLFAREVGTEPTRSVLFRSAATLALHSKNYSEINELVNQGLAGNPTRELFRELLDLLINKQQQEFCYSDSKFLRLLAPAGSGKTASLLWRCLDKLKENEQNKFLLFTFTRVARDELRLRLNTDNQLIPLRDKVKIETLNEWGNKYIQSQKRQLVLKTSKIDYGYLVRNNLRPQWEGKPVLGNIEDVYSQNRIINVFSELKTLGFDHTGSKKQF